MCCRGCCRKWAACFQTNISTLGVMRPAVWDSATYKVRDYCHCMCVLERCFECMYVHSWAVEQRVHVCMTANFRVQQLTSCIENGFAWGHLSFDTNLMGCQRLNCTLGTYRLTYVRTVVFSAGKWGCHGMVRALYCCVLPPEDTRDLEEKAAKTLLHLGKIPVGWEEALFITGVVSSCVSFKPQ